MGRIASAVWCSQVVPDIEFCDFDRSYRVDPSLPGKCLLWLCILFGIVRVMCYFPQWLFQGLERMVTVSMINFGG